MKNSKKENKFIFKLIVVIIILILSSAIIKRIYTKIIEIWEILLLKDCF